MNKALIVLDVQEGLFKDELCNKVKVVQTINAVIAACRSKQIPIIFVQHEDEDFKEGEPDFQIHPKIDMQKTDRFFRKHKWDAFFETGLDAYLKENAINRLYIVGAQTEYYMDTTIRCGFSLGYQFYIFKNGHTTFDGIIPAEQIVSHHENIWNGRFAELIDPGQITV